MTSLPRHLGPPPVTRRPPIINIGTYLRCEMIDRLVEDFLLADGEEARSGDAAGKGKGRQIISVGAGSDARYWRIMVSCSAFDVVALHQLLTRGPHSVLLVK